MERKEAIRGAYRMTGGNSFYPDIVNVAQVQSMLNISRHLAYSLINDGYIPGIKIGNAYRVPKVNVINYALSAGNSGPAA